jgi:hypothetical protein
MEKLCLTSLYFEWVANGFNNIWLGIIDAFGEGLLTYFKLVQIE